MRSLNPSFRLKVLPNESSEVSSFRTCQCFKPFSKLLRVALHSLVRWLTKSRQLHCIKRFHCFVSFRHIFCIQYRHGFVLANVFKFATTSINHECWYHAISERLRVTDDSDGDITARRISPTKCALGKKRAKNYIFISAGGRGNMFTYFARIGLLLKTPRCYQLQPVILEQINLNWNKKQNFHFHLC